MEAVVRTILILLIEMAVCYFLGTASNRILLRRKCNRIAERLIIGFLVLQILFQICAIPFIYFDTTLTLLAKAWTVVILVVLLGSVVLVRKELRGDIKGIGNDLKKKKAITVGLCLVIIAMCYYVAINGERNEDSAYYIGLINTTLSMDSMYRFNVYNGYGMESLYLRRVLTTFDIHSAVLCKMFGVHPLILARVGRASLNVILTAAATYLMGTRFFRKDNRDVAERKASLLVIISFVMCFLFAGNIYTSATFLLTRAYEGKAFAANVLVLFTTYICLRHITEDRKNNWLLYLLTLWGSIAVSSSALVVNAMAMGVFMLPYYGIKIIRKNEYWGNRCDNEKERT